MIAVDYGELSSKIFSLNQDVRIVAVLNGDGKPIAGGVREGIKPLYDKTHENLWFNQIAIRKQMSTMFDRYLGKLHFVFVYREKVKQLTFYVNDEIVFVSLQPWVSEHDAVGFGSSVLDLLKSK